MKEYINILLKDYLNDESRLIDSSKNYYKKFVKEFPSYLYQYFDKNKYLIKASVGVGQKNENPWLCIFNKDVTTSATQGIYICFLFRKDMSGFYLGISQGITVFKNLFGKDKYKNIGQVADCFKKMINTDDFSKAPIDLRSSNVLAKGCEFGTVISKFYDKNNYSEEILLRDLISLKKIYDEICENLADESYMDIVDNVIQNGGLNLVTAVKAHEMIENAEIEKTNLEKIKNSTLCETAIPKINKKNKFSKFQNKNIRKIDYVKKAKTNAENGLLGEKLVLDYEENRLINIGRKDLASKIKFVSMVDDNKGYDIFSFDVDENNNVTEKYIEVKTTEGKDNDLFYRTEKNTILTLNELKTLNDYRGKYFIYRVYNLKKDPKFFILGYDDFNKKIELDPYSYTASIKEE